MPQPSFNIDAFREGVAAGRALGLGDPFSLVCHGFAAVFRAAGLDRDATAVAARWHDPLAGATPEDLEEPTTDHGHRWSLVRQMLAIADGVASANLHGRGESYEIRTLREGRLPTWHLGRVEEALYWLGDDEHALKQVEFEAKFVFNQKYKHDFPGKRLGTKHYKERWAKDGGSFLLEARYRLVDEARDRMRAAESWFADDGRRSVFESGHALDRRSILATVADYRMLAAEVEVIASDAPSIAKLRDRAQEIVDLWVHHDGEVCRRMAEFRRKLSVCYRLHGEDISVCCRQVIDDKNDGDRATWSDDEARVTCEYCVRINRDARRSEVD